MDRESITSSRVDELVVHLGPNPLEPPIGASQWVKVTKTKVISLARYVISWKAKPNEMCLDVMGDYPDTTPRWDRFSFFITIPWKIFFENI